MARSAGTAAATVAAAVAAAGLLALLPPAIRGAHPPPAWAGEPTPLTEVQGAPAPLPPAPTAEEVAASRAASKPPKGPAAKLAARAKAAAAAGDFDAAAAAYDALIEAAPGYAGGYSNRANVEVSRPRLAAAAADYTAALRLAPYADDAWVVLLNRASVRTALGDGAGALADLDAAVVTRSRGPGCAKGEGILWAIRALAYMTVGRYDAALADFSRAVEARPNEVAPWWLAYGQVLVENSRAGDGVGILKRVEGRYGTEDDPHAVLAAVQFVRGRVAEAETE